MDVGNNDESTARNRRQLSPQHLQQIGILQALAHGVTRETGIRPYELEEIGIRAGVPEERDIQRILYILEGHKLVSPCPPGDFTARLWQITGEGLQAVRKLKQSLHEG